MTEQERVSSETLCAAAGISPATLHRWVALGLLPRATLTSDGRGVRGMYPREALERIPQIAAARARGLSLTEIAASFNEAKVPKKRKRRKT